MHYDFDTLDLADHSDAARSRRRGWLHAVQRGFHQGRPGEEYEKIWLDHVTADHVTCQGAWLPEGAYGAGPVPVATFAWFDKTLNAGRDLLPLRMISEVTTSPAHRRRGLVRRMMEDCLADAVAQGVPLAALTVSEATIYGRWGFGPATFAQSVELDTGPRFGLRGFTDAGRVELVDPGDIWPVTSELLDRFHRTTRGSVGTPQFYEPFLTGAWNFQESGPDKMLRGVVHLTEGEAVDGLVLYRYDGRDGEKRKVKVVMMLASDPSARLALWQFLGGIDLVNQVTWEVHAPDDPLLWALRDMNALKVTQSEEFLWVRLLDVPVALAGRPWATDDRLVIQVSDSLGHADGRYLVTTHAGVAEVSRTDADADVLVDAETLASLYLGTVDVATLHGAQRVGGEPEAVARFAAMADLPDPPYNILGF